MKKVALLAVLALLILSYSCSEDSSSSSGGLFDTSGLMGELHPQSWNMMVQSMPALQKYFVTVSSGGGSGAVISVSLEAGGATTQLGNFQVFDGVPIPIPPNGPSIQMGSTTTGFNLVKDDQWVFMFEGGQLVGIFPTKVDTSAVKLSVAAAPVSPKCHYGLFNAFPGVSMGPQSVSMSPMRIKANSSLAEGAVPETSMLLFSTSFPLVALTPVVFPGDNIEISYNRKIVSDGKGGDYFEVVAVSDRRTQLLELVNGASSPAQTVTKDFISDGTFVGIQFVFGAATPADSMKLDNFKFKVNGVEIFSEDFEGATLKSGLPNFIWMPAKPATMLGSAGQCATGPLDDLKSWCVAGGRSWTLYGNGAAMGGVQALEFTLTDGSVGTSFFEGYFMGEIINSVMAGTYGGRNYDSSCTEQGAFVTLINPSQTAYVAGTWNLSVQGQLKHCDDNAFEDQPVAFTVANVPEMQVSTIFAGLLQSTAPTITDSLGNQISVNGFVMGNSLAIMASTTVPTSMVYRLTLQGIAGASPVSGQAMGWAAPNPLMIYQTCDVQGLFTLSISP